jgi:hypothetical protein
VSAERFSHTDQGWDRNTVTVTSKGDPVTIIVNGEAGRFSVASAVRAAGAILRSAGEASNGYCAPLTRDDIKQFFAEVGVDIDNLGTDKLF